MAGTKKSKGGKSKSGKKKSAKRPEYKRHKGGRITRDGKTLTKAEKKVYLARRRSQKKATAARKSETSKPKKKSGKKGGGKKKKASRNGVRGLIQMPGSGAASGRGLATSDQMNRLINKVEVVKKHMGNVATAKEFEPVKRGLHRVERFQGAQHGFNQRLAHIMGGVIDVVGASGAAKQKLKSGLRSKMPRLGSGIRKSA